MERHGREEEAEVSEARVRLEEGEDADQHARVRLRASAEAQEDDESVRWQAVESSSRDRWKFSRHAQEDRHDVDARVDVHHEEEVRDEAVEDFHEEVPKDADIRRQVRVACHPEVRALSQQHAHMSDTSILLRSAVLPDCSHLEEVPSAGDRVRHIEQRCEPDHRRQHDLDHEDGAGCLQLLRVFPVLTRHHVRPTES
jgi:hypothetical protein